MGHVQVDCQLIEINRFSSTNTVIYRWLSVGCSNDSGGFKPVWIKSARWIGGTVRIFAIDCFKTHFSKALKEKVTHGIKVLAKCEKKGEHGRHPPKYLLPSVKLGFTSERTCPIVINAGRYLGASVGNRPSEAFFSPTHMGRLCVFVHPSLRGPLEWRPFFAKWACFVWSKKPPIPRLKFGTNVRPRWRSR